jgi:hypothetical protein
MNKRFEAKKKREGLSDKEFNAHCENGRNRGTLIHAVTQSYWETGVLDRSNWNEVIDPKINVITGKPFTYGDYLTGFDSFVSDLKKEGRKVELVLAERAVVSDVHRFGGRFDLILDIDDRNHLFDLKTFGGYRHQYLSEKRGHDVMIYLWEKWRKPSRIGIKKRNPETGRMKTFYEPEVFPVESERDWSHVSHWVRDKFIQLALYRTAIFEDLRIPIHRCNILVLTPNGRYQLIPVPARVWAGCQMEAYDRVAQFWRTEGDRWKLMAKERELWETA